MNGQSRQGLRLPQDDLDAEEELRLAVVLNGGVSLAIWMGGVVVEIQNLTDRKGVYGRLLRALRCRARADIIAGTSAGGINGGALALGQVYPAAKVDQLREVWAQQGALLDLLQEPWKGQPASLLKGDERFLPALRTAFAELLAPASLPGENAYSAEDRPIHLTLTTTLLTAEERTITDALGEPVSQPSHAGQFRFLRIPEMLGGGDDFAAPVGNLADRLALAARSTASFPVAFEPVHVRVEKPRDADEARLTPEPPGPAPNMWAHTQHSFGVSRWVVDGGVLMNTPLRPVLEAIQAAPAALQVRRALLLVVPDPYQASEEEKAPKTADKQPTTLRTLAHIVASVESQTVAEELHLIEEHNMRAQARRDSRTDMLATITDGRGDVVEELVRLADSLFRNYRDIRIWRAASNIAKRTAPILGEPAERLAHEIRGALRDRPGSPRHLPWVPDTFAEGLAGALSATRLEVRSADTAQEWGWGLATLERLSVAVHDLLKRAIWVISPARPEREQIMALREQHSRITVQLMALRAADSAYWEARARAVRKAQPEGTLPREVLARALREGLAQWPAGLWEILSTPSGTERTVPPPPVPSFGAVAAELLEIGHQAARVIPRLPHDPDRLLQAHRLVMLQRVFDPAPAPEVRTAATPDEPGVLGTGAAGDALSADPSDLDRRMRAALGLEVCYLCLVESDDPTASEQVIDLVRISAGVRQPFAPTLEARDRVTGLRLGHFAAFLKQTWRANDWTWGRLDAANRLITLLLDPTRLRRQVVLQGLPSAAELAASSALPGGGSPGARRVLGTILGAEPGAEWADVLRLLDGEIVLARGRDTLRPLAERLICEIAEHIVADEDQSLVNAVNADDAYGEDPMSAGRKWLNARYGAVPATPTLAATVPKEA